MDNIYITIITPVYNTSKYLHECIDSIINQTYSNWELILVDDGSTDTSGKICDFYEALDDRIKVIHKENGGQLSARKVGAKVAKGEYILGVDSDDWIENDRIEKLVIEGLQTKPDIVYLNGRTREKNGESIKESASGLLHDYSNGDILHGFMNEIATRDGFFFERKILMSHWNSCIETSIYQESILSIDERIRRIEDVITIFSCVLQSKKVVVIDEAGYHYRYHSNSINSRKTNWSKNHSIWYYYQMKRIIAKNRANITEDVINAAVKYIYHNIFLTDYEKLYRYYEEYLFPYVKVHNGSRVIIYGAGNIGVEIINSLFKDCRFNVVAWVDKYINENPRSNYPISRIEDIICLKYDFILITIIDTVIAKEVREELINTGIEKNKIQMMSGDVMKSEDLQKILETK